MNAPRRPAALPLVPLYRAGLWLKDQVLHLASNKRNRLEGRVISIGSLSAGGAGKTPIVMLVAEMLRDAGHTVDILSRGYGRTGKAIEQVDPHGSASRFGDEPMLLARRLGLPVWVGASRFEAGKAAEQQPPSNPRTHLLDDGFQHRKLHRDLDLVLLTLDDVQDYLLPAGNLREPLAALQRADVIILREEEAEILRRSIPEGKKVWVIRRTLALPSPATSHPLVFCAIARPDGFLSMLKNLGVEPASVILFPDHHAYGMRDLTRLIAAAEDMGATGFLTTEKDYVKLTPAMLNRLQAKHTVSAPELTTILVEGKLDDLTSK